MNDLVRRNGVGLLAVQATAFPESPLTALAHSDPDGARSLMNRALSICEKQLQLAEVNSRRAAIARGMEAHADIACSWLANRDFGERHIRIANRHVSRRNTFFCSGGEESCGITQVDIW